MTILAMPVEELLAAVEAAAARERPGAEALLDVLLREEAETGGLGVVSRLCAKRFVNVGAIVPSSTRKEAPNERRLLLRLPERAHHEDPGRCARVSS